MAKDWPTCPVEADWTALNHFSRRQHPTGGPKRRACPRAESERVDSQTVKTWLPLYHNVMYLSPTVKAATHGGIRRYDGAGAYASASAMGG